MPSNARKPPTVSSRPTLVNRFRRGSELPTKIATRQQQIVKALEMPSNLEIVNGDQSKVPMSERMFAWWQHNAAWREKLHKRAAHKALDIDEEPMIEANRQTIHKGFGWPEMLVLAGALLGAAYLFKPQPPPAVAQTQPPPAATPAPIPTQPPAFTDTDTSTDVTFPQ